MFCTSDSIAMGVMRAILDAGFNIPQDIAILGCGNLHYGDLLRVPLSSMDQDTKGLGENVAKLTLSIIKRKTAAPPKTVLLPSKLVVRASSQR